MQKNLGMGLFTLTVHLYAEDLCPQSSSVNTQILATAPYWLLGKFFRLLWEDKVFLYIMVEIHDILLFGPGYYIH